MNTPDLPLEPELLDELLNADLDGELDRAAPELGYTPATARAAIEATPGAGARRDALVRARDLFARTPTLAPQDEARLVARVLMRADELRDARTRRTERRRRETTWRVLAAVASAAAVVAVIVGLANVDPAGNAKSADSAAPERAATATTGNVTAKKRAVVFGQVAGANALRLQVNAAIKAAGSQVRYSADSAATTTVGAAWAPGPETGTGPVGPIGATGPAAPAAPAELPDGALRGGSGFVSDKSVDGIEGLAGTDGLLAMAGPRGLVGTDGVVVNAPAAVPQSGVPRPAPPVALAPATAMRCVAAAMQSAGPGFAELVTGPAAYGARRVAVVVLQGTTAYVAYVLSVPNCSEITRVAIP